MSEQQMPETARHLRESERAADLTPQLPLSREAGETQPGLPPRPTFLRSFVYAWRGIVYAVRTQRNMRVHIALAVVAIALGVALRISPVEFAMIFVAITGVFIAEMINTVAEACVDLATQTYHPLARVAQDVAAGAVLISA
ncbi:MAG: diacylglycerol kinase family protein, partial [Ktedonobacterales bacterium]